MKTLTHVLAGAFAMVWAFALSPQGQAIIASNPKITAVFAGLSSIVALYYKPAAPK